MNANHKETRHTQATIDELSRRAIGHRANRAQNVGPSLGGERRDLERQSAGIRQVVSFDLAEAFKEIWNRDKLILKTES